MKQAVSSGTPKTKFSKFLEKHEITSPMLAAATGYSYGAVIKWRSCGLRKPSPGLVRILTSYLRAATGQDITEQRVRNMLQET